MNFWGEPDISVSFCEDKYKEVYWIAEFYNTISSFLYIFVGTFFLNTRVSGLAKCIIGVGLGSICLHGTLRYYGQWLDELSMIGASVYGLHEIVPQRKPKSYFPFMIILYLFLNQHFIIFFTVFSVINIYLMWTIIKKKWRDTYIFLYVLFFSLGSICWVLDQLICEKVQHLYLHAVWHIFTAIGIFFMMMYNIDDVKSD